MALFCRNAEGGTAFMQAVSQRAYPAAITLLDCARRVASRPPPPPQPTVTETPRDAAIHTQGEAAGVTAPQEVASELGTQEAASENSVSNDDVLPRETVSDAPTTRECSGELDQTRLMSMIYPKGSSLANSPLHVICCNDTCSFTWTGNEHINQVSVHSTSAYCVYM